MSDDVRFHQTVRGRKFYEKQIPDLISVLEEISESLGVIADHVEDVFGVIEDGKPKQPAKKSTKNSSK